MTRYRPPQGCSPAGGAAKPGQAWPAPVISEQAAQVLGVLGLLASTGSGDEALDAQHLEEAVLDVAQVRRGGSRDTRLWVLEARRGGSGGGGAVGWAVESVGCNACT
jgi:hypothetical protein